MNKFLCPNFSCPIQARQRKGANENVPMSPSGQFFWEGILKKLKLLIHDEHNHDSIIKLMRTTSCLVLD